MRLMRRASVRSRIASLLAVLIALWAFAAWVTARESLHLWYLSYLDSAGLATQDVVEALQRERRLSTVVLGAGTDPHREELAQARATTDQQAAAWQDTTEQWGQRIAAGDRLSRRYEEFAAQLGGLLELRNRVDAGAVDRAAALEAYTATIDSGFAIYRAMSNLDDQEVARQSGLLVTLSQARELLARQDALLAGALAAGQLTEPELITFTQLVGGQRLLYQRTAAELPAEDRALFDVAADSAAVVELRRLEDRVMADAQPGADPPVTAAGWEEVATAATVQLRQVELGGVDNLIGRAQPVVIGIVVRLLLAGCLGLVAVILSVSTGRTLIRQLEQLRTGARELATARLPLVVRRLGNGEEVDVRTEAPPVPDPGGREMGQLAAAFNAVQLAAVEAAVGQANLHRGVRDVFLSLARRTQNLLRRQLKALDQAQQQEIDPDKLAELFRIDHLATRMRRNAENLIVLSGASTSRKWRHPVAIVDVVRGAISEVEDYTRVNVLAVDPGALAGQVVGDVIHLLAELMENAVSYSPPYAQVTVSGHRVARGFAIEIEDRGLGMSQEDLATVNRKLADPPDFSFADASHLGHYVVAKLAERHHIQVQLRRSPYGGVSAVVLIPIELIAETAGEQPPPLPATTTATATGTATATATASAAVAPAPVAPDAPPARPAPRPVTPDQPPVGGPPGVGGLTPAGLPWRVRQSSMPKQLREAPGRDEPAPDPEDTLARDPETVRLMMTSYQRGTARGRAETAEADAADAPPPRTAHHRNSQEV